MRWRRRPRLQPPPSTIRGGGGGGGAPLASFIITGQLYATLL